MVRLALLSTSYLFLVLVLSYVGVEGRIQERFRTCRYLCYVVVVVVVVTKIMLY